MKAHRTDITSLVFGLCFLAIVGLWLLFKTTDFSLPDTRWLIAGALIVLGAFGLIGTLRANRVPAAQQSAVHPDSSATTQELSPSQGNDTPPATRGC